MNKIPSAEEFLKDVIEVPFRHTKIVEADVAKEKLIRFAKLHVKAALQSARDKSQIEFHQCPDCRRGEGEWLINKESILNSYPETNIK